MTRLLGVPACARVELATCMHVFSCLIISDILCEVKQSCKFASPKSSSDSSGQVHSLEIDAPQYATAAFAPVFIGLPWVVAHFQAGFFRK